MTRDEFLTAYAKRSGIEQYRTPTGFKIGDMATVALPCACGDEVCEGWALVPDRPEEIAAHNRAFAPTVA